MLSGGHILIEVKNYRGGAPTDLTLSIEPPAAAGTLTPTATATATPAQTETATSTPTPTATPTHTPIPADTATPTAIATATLTPPPAQPRPPQNLQAAATHNSVTLTWDDPGDSSITGYQILRRNRDVDAVGEFTIIEDDTGNAATRYVDNTVLAESRYGYRIKARNVSGLSQRSMYADADTPSEPTPTPIPTATPTATPTPTATSTPIPTTESSNTLTSGGSGTASDPYIITDPTSVSAHSIHSYVASLSRRQSVYFRWDVGGRPGSWTVRIDATPTNHDFDLFGRDDRGSGWDDRDTS